MDAGRNRRGRRFPIHWPTLLVDGEARRGCTIVDVSRLGAKIRISEPVEPKARVTFVDNRVGTIEATVMWRKGDLAGVAFHQPSPAAAAKLRNIIKLLEEAEGRRPPERPRPVFGRRGLPKK